MFFDPVFVCYSRKNNTENKWVEKERDGGWVSTPYPRSSTSVKSEVTLIQSYSHIMCVHGKPNAIWLGRAWASPTLAGLHCGSVLTYMLAWGHIPYILNTCLNISQKLNILQHCQCGNRSGDTSSLSPTVPYFLLVTAPMDWPSTADCSQTVQNYTRQVGGSLQEGVVHNDS